MNNLVARTKEDRLPPVVKSQLTSTGHIQTVKTEASLVLIQDAIIELQKPLAVTATASELSKAIKKMFILMQKPNSSTNDVKTEIAEYIKLLQGQPLWVVEKAVDSVCRQYSFRDFSKLYKEIENIIEPHVKKIERLQNIYKKSIKEMEEDKALKEAMDNCPSLYDALKDFDSKNNSEIARRALAAIKLQDECKEAAKTYQDCNNLGQDFLDKRSIVL